MTTTNNPSDEPCPEATHCGYCMSPTRPLVGRCHRCHTPLCRLCAVHCVGCGETFCLQCSTRCESCADPLCDDCADCPPYAEGQWCPACYAHETDSLAPEYQDPYQNIPGDEHLTIGLEIEVDGPHDHEAITRNDLIAGWCADGSLDRDGWEYQTQPLDTDPQTLSRLHRLIAGIRPLKSQEHAGGHIHISRASGQYAADWACALDGLDANRAAWLNMRHADPEQNRWCRYTDYYHGKEVAVNDDHDDTIELRTFGPWNADTAEQLLPAIKWIKTMWRLFQRHPNGLSEEDIEAASRTAWADAVPASAREKAVV
ncbi:hypothetical protein [Bifidobacterium sp. ESL0820]|uniref:hypothetical protein n=1 Tax=Bifidobacterium sp. ESL0820 TaxID=3448586 RepID=UPI00404209E8